MLRCVTPNLCVVCGTNGLLALVCADGIKCAGTTNQSSFFALTVDDFTPTTLAGDGTVDADFPPFSHSSSADITAIDCTMQTGTHQSELALVSVDEAGLVCMWHVRYCIGLAPIPGQSFHGGATAPSSAITLLSARSTPHSRRTFGTPAHYIRPVGLPLQMPGGRIYSVALSPSGTHVVVANAHKLSLLRLSAAGPEIKTTLDVMPSTASSAASCPCKYAAKFTAGCLIIGRVSPVSEQEQEQEEGQGHGVVLHCWQILSPDRFDARHSAGSGAEAYSPARSSSGTEATPALPTNPLPIHSSIPSSYAWPHTELHLKGMGMAMSHCGVPPAAPIALQVLYVSLTSCHQQPPVAGESNAVPPAAARVVQLLSASTGATPPLPVLLPSDGLPCETALTQLFGSPESLAFRACKPLLTVLLASLDVTIGQLIPAGAVPVALPLSEPVVACDVQGPPIGLLAAALNMDVLCLHMLLTTHAAALRHLIAYAPFTDLMKDAVDVVSSPPLAALFTSFHTGTGATPGFFSPKLQAAGGRDTADTAGTANLCSMSASNADEDEPDAASPYHEVLRVLAETTLQPTALLLRGGVGQWLGSRDSWKHAGAACVGPKCTAGGAGGATSGWSAHSTGGSSYSVKLGVGHNALAALYLKNCGNKSVAVEHQWQEYLRQFGPTHFRRSDRGLRELTRHVRKIDETSGLKDTLPRQLGYVSGLQEIYARRVGLSGRLPVELCLLVELRVLSMGNNFLAGNLPPALGTLPNLQRIVLHQNKLTGNIPDELVHSGCIVNLAGNPGLELGPDVPASERAALQALYTATSGSGWLCATNWADDSSSVSQWYKVGTLAGHVHSLVMSSNGMKGKLPAAIAGLKHIRMIELATMPELNGTLLHVCSLVTLRRLCICRCSLTGEIPPEIGNLASLEELQLFGNKLSGQIPDSFGGLSNLKLLSLGEYTGGNNFAPGPLALCIRRLKSLEALFMSSCQLTGPVPAWIGELTNLRQLDVQHNNISGLLPDSLGNLTNLLYLNFKDNARLSGVLPVQTLSKLRRLNRLSFVNTDVMSCATLLKALQKALPSCKIWN